jgi:dihydroflavonol-4-reductase
MRAFVTGATGFIGWHLVQVLRDNGCQVRALVRTASGPVPDGVEIVPGDLASASALQLGDAMRGCDAVFHVGALYSLCQRDRAQMYQVNVDGTRRMIEGAFKAQVARFVYTSSTATVGLHVDGTPADETRWARAEESRSDYKRSKIWAEALVRDAVAKGLDAVIVNPSTPIGAHDWKPTPTGRVIWDAVRGRMPAYLDTGLNWVSVRDVAIGHWLAFRRGRTGERYILGHENLPLYDILVRIAKHVNGRPPRWRMPHWMAWLAAVIDEDGWSRLTGRSPRIPKAGVWLARQRMYFTAEKAVRELGLPQTPVSLALAEAIEWFQGFSEPASDPNLATSRHRINEG